MLRDLLYRARKALAETFLGADAAARVSDPYVELRDIVGQPVLQLHELHGLRRTFLVGIHGDTGFYLSLSEQGDWWNLDVYKYLFVVGREMDYIQSLFLLRELQVTALSPSNAFSVIYPTKQGYGLFYNVANLTHRKVPWRRLYNERATAFIQRAQLRHSEFLNLLREEYEVYDPSPEELAAFILPHVPPTAGKVLESSLRGFVGDVARAFSTRVSSFVPLYLALPFPHLIGLFRTPSQSSLAVMYLDVERHLHTPLSGKVRLDVKGVFVSAWKLGFTAEYLKTSPGVSLDVSKLTPDLMREAALEFTPNIELVQERMREALDEIASYVFSRSSVIAETRVFIEHSVVERNRVEHYLYLVVSPRSLRDSFYVHDFVFTVEAASSVVEAKLKKMWAEGRVSYQAIPADHMAQRAVLDPVLFVKKVDQIVGNYPFPQPRSGGERE